MMSVLTVSKARANLHRLIDQASETHQPVLISGKRTNAVLISEDDWSAIQETLHLLAIPRMRHSIKDAMAEPLSKYDLDALLAEMPEDFPIIPGW
jgi:prevent-host-death family protein